eukprot:jgi/Ulvmu1/5084/UM021_0101.1
MSVVPLPSSFIACGFLVAAGWFATTSQASLLRPPVKEAARQLMIRVTLPAFIFQVLAAGGGILRQSAQVAVSATVAHMLLCFGIGWLVTRGQRKQQQALLAVLSLGYEAETWGVAWCSVMWGVAGAQVAAVAACTAAVLYPVLTFAVGSFACMGVPADLRHADGGTYTGQWSRSTKNGLGVYRYKNGAKYEGWWKDNKKHGLGVYHYADSGRFEGEFAKGARNGIGIRIWPHGTVKAAYFENDQFMRSVDLAVAAHVMQAANEAADAARHVGPTRLTLQAAARKSFLNSRIAACSAFVMAAVASLPVTEAMEMALVSAASVHIPLALVLFGASLPKTTPEKRHAPQIRTVLATRLLSALIVAAGALVSTTNTDHAIHAAAVAACLLSPVASQALRQAQEWKMSNTLLDGVAVTSALLSALCMGLFSLQAWVKDVVPVFAVMSRSTIDTFPLVDHCLILFILLSTAAYFAPRLFCRKVVKMTLKADSALRPEEAINAAEQPQPNLPSLRKPGPLGALGYRHKCVYMTGIRYHTFTDFRTRIPLRMVPSGCTRPVLKW